jgi:hypothetical protein
VSLLFAAIALADLFSAAPDPADRNQPEELARERLAPAAPQHERDRSSLATRLRAVAGTCSTSVSAAEVDFLRPFSSKPVSQAGGYDVRDEG